MPHLHTPPPLRSCTCTCAVTGRQCTHTSSKRTSIRCRRSVAPRLAVPAVATAVALSTAVATVAVCKPVAAAAGEALPFTGVPGTPHERSFVAIKPDGVQRGLVCALHCAYPCACPRARHRRVEGGAPL
ncbi:hypothetical protein EON67_04905 [archaeon]|nr:MAG: hypothetical protein EON67_04905 [archaeon]